MPLSNSSATEQTRDVLATGVRSLLGAHLVAQPKVADRVRGVSRRPWTIMTVPGETADILEPGVPRRLMRAGDVVVHAARELRLACRLGAARGRGRPAAANAADHVKDIGCVGIVPSGERIT